MLSPTELQDEAVVQLHQLAQSPGWGLYKARLRSLSRSNEAAKAVALRAYKSDEALYSQGVVDGLQLAQEELERYVKRLATREANLSSESG